MLSLDEQEPIFSPSPVKPTNCGAIHRLLRGSRETVCAIGAAVDVQEVFRMEALFFGAM